MANNVNAPGVSNVPDPGGLRYSVNSIMPTPALGGAPQGPAMQNPGGPQATPGTGNPTQPQSTLPLNSPRGQAAPQLGGGSPAPAVQPVSGVSSAPGVSSVPDPGGLRYALGSTQMVGGRDPSTPGGGDPG